MTIDTYTIRELTDCLQDIPTNVFKNGSKQAILQELAGIEESLISIQHHDIGSEIENPSKNLSTAIKEIHNLEVEIAKELIVATVGKQLWRKLRLPELSLEEYKM